MKKYEECENNDTDKEDEYTIKAKRDFDKDKVYVLIIYDIIDDKKRLKLSNLLQGYGFRIQKSAFEAIINRRKYRKLLESLPAYAKEEDSIIVYKLTDRSQVTAFGKVQKRHSENVIVI